MGNLRGDGLLKKLCDEMFYFFDAQTVLFTLSLLSPSFIKEAILKCDVIGHSDM